MGSQTSKFSKTVVGNETHNSARNVLEGFAKDIKRDVSNNAKRHGKVLKGNLRDAKFYHDYSKLRDIPRSPCDLDFWFHTNVWRDKAYERDPCYGRQAKNNYNLEGAVCTNSKIKGNENKINDIGACAPYRRRNICDYNLEHLNERNVLNTHDLLGNVLVMAKREGESIVEKHPNRGSSEVCIALARSFADIGDILRGKDMYVGYDEKEKNRRKQLENKLKDIFDNIYKDLTKKKGRNGKKSALQERYNDPKGDFFQLREDWWALNREDVWKALTCSADDSEDYFIQSEGVTKSFTNPKCGHGDNEVLTNLDYVPQFLRWFTEWAEEFCRIRKIKLGKVKNECRGETSGKRYCSGDGYDCTKTDISRNIFYMDLDCPRCEEECRKYDEWIENKENELDKQKNKYTKEIEKLKDNSKSNYDKNFYLTLTKKYGSINLFLDTLKEGSHCSYNTIEDKIDFNKANQTFTSSKFCGACPFYGVKCNWKTCTEVKENEYKKKNKVDSTHTTEQPTAIDVLVTHIRGTNIPEDLKDCKKYGLFKGMRKQAWKCQYINPYDECKLSPFVKDIDVDDRILFKVLFERWLKYFIQDFNNVKDKINRCTKFEKGKDNTCIKGCKHKCECVEKWIKIKEAEWKKINQHYNQQKKHYTYSVPRWVNSYLTHQHFSSDFINALEAFKNIRGLENLKECSSDTCKIEKIRTIDDDLIKELISKLKDKCAMCKNQHKATKGKECCGKLPKTLNDQDDEEDEEYEAPPPPTPPRTQKNPCVNGQNQKVRKIRSVRRVPKRMQKQASVRVPRARQGGEREQVVKNGRQDHHLQRVLLVGEAEAEEPETAEEKKEEEKEEDTDGKVQPPPAATTPGVKPPCDIVEKHFKDKHDNTGAIDHCNPKKDYPPWKNDKSLVDEDGVYMPPRRQKLCVINLEHFKENTSDDLREAFIKCAAAETYLLWQKYKEDNNGGEDLQNQLKSGKIPEDFKRQMFYTFGDYRDFLFGTDISKLNKHTEAVKTNIDRIFPPTERTNDTIRKEFWEKNAESIWQGMLCALSYNSNDKKMDPDVQKELNSTYNYDTIKNNLEDFANRPQFLRWFIEWSDEFCRERKKKEEKVGSACKNDYEGCANTKDNGNGNCVNACNAYKKYITDKKEQYEKQAKKFDIDKSQNKPGYEDYSGKKASEYLKEKCINSSCDYMLKLKDNSNYWEKPHTTYDDNSLQNKCSCPLSPCEIVDKTLGDKTSKSYAEGCKWKYGKMPLGLGWLCNDKEGEKGKEDGLCIPPRRKRLYVKDLETFSDHTTVGLREAFIKCAAVETFFAWHEFTKEKEREYKEEKQRNGELGFIDENDQIPKDPDNPQNKIRKNGEIHEEFKSQMFYTLADYRDILFGNNIGIGNDMGKVKSNIDKVFANSSGKTPTAKKTTPKEWWEKNAKDIWEGMLCALSYDTKTKIKNEELRKKLIDPKNSNYMYEKVTFSSDNNTNLSKFTERPPFFRWFQEWGEEFCRKKKIKIDKIEKECRGPYGRNHCDGDGFDCSEIGPNENGSFAIFKCPSCAISCRSYKTWINTKKDEFKKQEKLYNKEIKDNKSNYDNIYDKEFVKNLCTDYKSVDSFLKKLKEGPCCNKNTKDSKIDFKDTEETFRNAEYCDPCPVFGVICNNGDCSNSTEKKCDAQEFKVTYDVKNKENPNKEVNMLVSDKTAKKYPGDLNGVCENSSIFEGIREDKWSCGYFCGLDICTPNKTTGDIHDKQNAPIRVLFKRWIENFLKDHNKIKDKISLCINNENRNICTDVCRKNCECIDKWIEMKMKEWKIVRDRYVKQYNVADSVVYEVRRFLEGLQPQNDLEKVKGDVNDLRDLEELSECTNTVSTENRKCRKKDVVESLLNKLKNEIRHCKNERDDSMGKESCKTLPEPTDDPQTDSDTHDTPDIPPGDVAPTFCNVPANPCGDKSATNVVNVTEVAKEMHEEAHKDMLERSVKKVESKVKDSTVESVLRADASKGEYKHEGNPDDLKHNMCNITKEHTNYQKRGGYNYRGPCTGKGNGKDTRFVIGTIWKDEDEKDETIKVLLPPRRRHMCTSNLEYLLHVNKGPLLKVEPDKINHSFLGDVLLAAKYEAEFIKTNYTRLNGQNDNGAKCRAMKYSFADIGDIIRGKDLWGIQDFKDLQTKLVTIFGKIKEEIPDIKKKYSSENPPYTTLREHWWEANRAKVWEAMQCPTIPPVTTSCDTTTVTPLVDYIPQRLRWMTEWAEWFCKMQSQEYEVLVKQCRNCRSGICENGKDDCVKCTQACNTYKQKIKKWEDQWKEISKKYKTLYQQAKGSVNGATTSSTTDEKDKDVVDFLKMLHQKNTDNTIYTTAAGFIHQEAHMTDCQKQTIFCKNTSYNDKKKYAFRHPPHDHDDACACRPPSTPVDVSRKLDTQRDPKKEESEPESEEEEDDAEEEEEPAKETATTETTQPAAPAGPPVTPVPELPGPPAPAGPAADGPIEDDEDAENEDDDDVGSATGTEDDDDDEDDDDEDEEDSADEGEGEGDGGDVGEEEDEDHGGQEAEGVVPQPAAPQPPTPQLLDDPLLKTALMSSTILWMVGIGFAALTYFLLKKKSKSSVDLLRVLNIPKGDYEMPTLKSKNRYIPYRSGSYKGKTYIYMEGDSDSGHYYEDTTDITSSESEYEELDINEIYPYQSPKYKTLIEVVLEPSKSNGNTPSKGDGNTLGDDMVPTTNTFTDEEWSELKHDFISQYIQSEPLDVPKVGVSKELPMNIGGNVLDDGINEKPFITSIHDRDLYTGEEIKYNINMGTNSMDDPTYVSNNVYSGIDLINDTLSGNQHIDIYDEVLKRKENELFGTNYKKNTSNNNVAKLTNSDPIMNQLDLLHTWLDRHRDMCEKWNKKEELLDKLNEQWNKDNDGGDIPNDNKKLNTDVSIQIDIDENKGKKEFSNMDTNVDTPTMDSILDDLETYNEPFYDIFEDDVYYDVYDENPFVDDIPMDHNKVDVPKKVHIEMKILNNTSNGSLEQQFPISDVWNI
ncbi:erythrocyte membrane protein 1 [Plasmodium falciparum NF54]|uniref:Erythrocyte membrane protein 1, PfEMP1 n=2 Tax=Plasmodium falciparum TaxID=5833 RepID=Q8IIZ4_PLAF7|nr:erythrocyte membrane protein 1, PfEMP1 [Plasmodium falciparum 3D7]KAF4327772.1 erythrocyte membrane protein 1 [Plasmodium falciparum NF54]PKC49147.1 erythrocyte membrane protein 1 [Plasmodium falciparum NF54]CZT98670.1 erythrocyte membrane protein 1, PfEMP1 [Plasmodium falciparum 3D7]|eukprot:XP_001347692.1 erythrocyte membrane protein 1, PfEMP1 [Plasmodium falciparum 3D7]